MDPAPLHSRQHPWPWLPLLGAACVSSIVASLSTFILLRSCAPATSASGHEHGPTQRRRPRFEEQAEEQHFASDRGAESRRQAPPRARELNVVATLHGVRSNGGSHGSPSAAPQWGVSAASKRDDPCDPRPREGYLEWDDYFMALAFLSAQRSKDPNKQVGAVIVGANKVVLGIGYNGFPRGCHDNALPWSKQPPPLPPAPPAGAPQQQQQQSPASPPLPPAAQQGGGSAAASQSSGTALYFDDPVLETKYPYVVHAEANALLNKNAASLDGASIYVTMFPCNECAKLLIQAGIRHVVYHEGKVQDKVGGDPELTRTRARAPSTPAAGVTGGAACAHPHHQHHHSPQQQRRGPNMDACYVASKRLLALAGVTTRQHRLRRAVLISGEEGGDGGGRGSARTSAAGAQEPSSAAAG